MKEKETWRIRTQAHPLPFVANNGKAAAAAKEHKHTDTTSSHTLLKPKTKAKNRMEN